MFDRNSLIISSLGVFVITSLVVYTQTPWHIGLTAILLYTSPLFLIIKLGKKRQNPNNDLDTDQKDASLAEQARLAEGFAEAIIILNQHQRIIFANAAAKSLFRENNVGTTLPNLVSNPAIRTLAEDTLSGKNATPVTIRVDKPVESHFRVMGSNITPQHESRTAKRAMIIFYDITDLVKVNSMRADFLANASHELKTPVASLLGYIETLRGHAKDDPEARETFLAIMQQQAERMQRLISDLLSLRRIELIEHLAPKEVGDLFLATRAALEAVEPFAKSRNIEIALQSPRTAPVMGVQDELIQLILNLLDNAVKFSPENGKITLTLDVLPNWQPGQIFSDDPTYKTAHKRRIASPNAGEIPYAVLRIRDEGPGFGREHLPRLGERFYKITDQDVSGKRGTGLGLAIVKHITLRHRGGLFVESAPGIGTRFAILLPAAPER